MGKLIKVQPHEVRVDDVLADGSRVTETWDDPEGTWISTDDGVEGYQITPILIYA